jgi:hypothetical protein
MGFVDLLIIEDSRRAKSKLTEPTKIQSVKKLIPQTESHKIQEPPHPRFCVQPQQS